MFRSLAGLNYRIWFFGALVSNVGTWMQRTAQDWIVLTELTHNNATAVGITMALQFGPQLVMLPITGWAADRFDRRKMLMCTQGAMAVLGAALGIMTITGVVVLWHVYVFALLLGIAAAFDAPARQSFVGELVDERNLSNAVALNSTSFNAARTIGPAIAGLMTAWVGAGPVFIINAVTFIAVLLSLKFMRQSEFNVRGRGSRRGGGLVEGFRYVRTRPDLIVIFIMVFLIGTFGLNFPIFTSTMASSVFGKGAGEFGVLSSVMAVGSVVGSLLAARREKPRVSMLFLGALAFGLGCALAAVMPTYWLFGASLALIGLFSQTLMTTANGTVQLATEPAVRGRVMAIYMAIFMGGTPIGAPIVGWVADAWGARWGLGVGAASGILAGAVGVFYLVKYRGLRMRVNRWRPMLVMEEPEAARPEVAAA